MLKTNQLKTSVKGKGSNVMCHYITALRDIMRLQSDRREAFVVVSFGTHPDQHDHVNIGSV